LAALLAAIIQIIPVHRGEIVIRICLVSMRMHLDRMQMCLDDIRAAIREISND
jgi:hypothetical protein